MRWFGITVACIVIAGLYIPVCMLLLENRARTVVRTAAALYDTPNKTISFGEAQKLYKGRLKQMPSCTAASCGYELELNNRLLSAIHWTPFSELRAEVWVENGVVATQVLDFTSSANELHSVVSHVYIQGRNGDGPEFLVDPWEQSSAHDTNGILSISPDSLRSHRQMILGFDFACLTRRRGCATVADLLPTVWERRSDGKIECRLQNHKGLIEGPKWLDDAL
jgi:hypothetical protein